jgi:hypothetical protein
MMTLKKWFQAAHLCRKQIHQKSVMTQILSIMENLSYNEYLLKAEPETVEIAPKTKLIF